MGGNYIKNEGGYKIILKSLTHYQKRLKTIHASPELKEAAAMFAPILQSTAKKRIPLIDETKEKIEKFLIGSTTSEFLEKDIEILEKSLECRKSDIEKAENTSDEYFLKLLKDLEEAKKDVIPINYALKKIKEYSE
jgi:bacterioferritin (cytochrome b1)